MKNLHPVFTELFLFFSLVFLFLLYYKYIVYILIIYVRKLIHEKNKFFTLHELVFFYLSSGYPLSATVFKSQMDSSKYKVSL